MSSNEPPVPRRASLRLLMWILLGVALKVGGFLALINVEGEFQGAFAYLAPILIVAGILVVGVALYRFAVSSRP